MRFYKNLYVGQSIKNPQKVKWKLKTGRGQLSAYVISISNSEDQLDCFHNALLKQSYFPKKDVLVIGIAGNYQEALELIENVTRDVVARTGNADIKKYLLERF